MEKFPSPGIKPETQGYTPSLMIRECFSLWISLSDDIVSQYNQIVSEYDAYTRHILGIPILNRTEWARQFKNFVNQPFSQVCTICDKHRDALLALEEPVGAQMWSPALGRFDQYYAEATLDSRCHKDPFEVRAKIFKLFNILWSFPRKLKVECDVLDNLTKQKWIDFEQSHPTFPTTLGYLPELRKIIERWIKDADLSVFPTGHGPGTTAEGITSKAKKYTNLRLTHDQFLMANTYSVETRGCIITNHTQCPSRVCLVPKKWNTKRVISAEPIGNQWLQQALMKILYRHYEHHPYLKTRMNLFDQTRNRTLCQEASYYGRLATVDSSAASDSLSYEVVRYLFERTPIWDYMDMCRSKYTLAFGKVYKTQKFAPMGNGLCFPIESCIFGACAELACKLTRQPTRWSVYGDDIILPSKSYRKLCQILNFIGVSVNMEKSFATGPFRESCGKEYLNGYDVTPIYYRLPGLLTEKCVKPATYAAAIELVNTLYEHKFLNCRRQLLGVMVHWKYRVNSRRKQYKTVVLPFSLDKSTTFITVDKISSVKYRSFDLPGLHRPCAFTTYVCAQTRSMQGSCIQPLYDWLAHRAFNPHGDCLQMDPYARRAEGTRLKTGWTYDPGYWNYPESDLF